MLVCFFQVNIKDKTMIFLNSIIKDKTSHVLLAISFMLSFIYYFKMEDYKTNSPTHIYCGPELELKSSRGIFEKFAITEEVYNE